MDAIFLRCLGLITIAIFSCTEIQAAPPETNQPAGFRLSVELKDGSRVIGKSLDANFEFRSDILGDTKLPLKKIRSIECQANTNLAVLTTATADSLRVQIAMKDIRVETAFGDVKLPVALIKSVKVSAFGGAGRPKDGLIALWSGEGDAADSVGGNDGVLQNVGFVKGVVGQAFSFPGKNHSGYTGIQIPDKPDFELTHSLSLVAWIRPRGYGYAILTRGDRRPGFDPYNLSLDGRHNLTFTICDSEGTSPVVETPIGLGAWIHVAAVLDDDTGEMILYTNGVLAATTATSVRPFGPLIPDLSPGVGIGNVNEGGFPFIGDIDEVALYGRALSAAEVNALYKENASNAGERAPLTTTGTLPYFGTRQPGLQSD